jgi:hypothetical protein
MSKAKKERKPKGNRANIVKKLKLIAKNQEILKRLKN